MKKERLFFWGILLACIGLRCIQIDGRGIQYDDAFSIFLAEQSLPAIVSGTAADTMPPLYYFLLHYWMSVGNQLWFIRLLSVAFSAGGIAVLYFIMKELVDRRAALWACVFMGISPLQIYHAQDVRMYAQLAFFQLLYFWFFIRIIKAPERGRTAIHWIGFVLSGAFAMYTHNLAVFGLCVPAVYLLVTRQWRRLGKVLAANLCTGLLALPWLVMVPGQIGKIQSAFWTPRPGLVEIMQAAIMLVGTLPLPWLWLAVTAVLSLQVIFLVVFLLWRGKIWNEGILFLVCCVLVPPVLLFIASYLMRPVFVPRGFLVSAAAFSGLAGVAAGSRTAKGAGYVVSILIAAAALISLPYQITYDQFPRSRFKAAADYLSENYSQQAAIVHDNKLSFFPMAFYQRDLPQEFMADEPGSLNDTLAYETQKFLGLFPQKDFAEAAGDKDEVFFVVFKTTIDEYREMGEEKHPAVAWLKGHYPHEEIEEFGDLQVFHFAR